MEKADQKRLDSLLPHSMDSGLPTLPPKRRNRRRLWIISATFLQGTGLFAGLLTYWLLLDPVLGEFRLFGALLVGCTFLTSASSLVANYLLFQELKSRGR